MHSPLPPHLNHRFSSRSRSRSIPTEPICDFDQRGRSRTSSNVGRYSTEINQYSSGVDKVGDFFEREREPECDSSELDEIGECGITTEGRRRRRSSTSSRRSAAWGQERSEAEAEVETIWNGDSSGLAVITGARVRCETCSFSLLRFNLYLYSTIPDFSALSSLETKTMERVLLIDGSSVSKQNLS